MRVLVKVLCALVLMSPVAIAAQGPEIQIVDGKVSMHAEGVTLGRLLSLFDRATGMNSEVPSDLAARNVSVQFSDLDMNAAVQKIFEGRSLDYVFIDGRGVVVTAISQSGPAATSGSVGVGAPSPFGNQPSFVLDAPFQDNRGFAEPGVNPGFPMAVDPFNQQQQQMMQLQQQQLQQQQQQQQQLQGNTQPAIIQTPFGPIPNPRANPINGTMVQESQVPTGTVDVFGNTTQPVPPGLPGMSPTPFPAVPQPASPQPVRR